MTYARTRPPGHPGGRHPNGPRTVPVPRKDLVANLRAASAKLRTDGAPKLADTVDELLQPGGWSKLRSAVDPVELVTKPLKLTSEDRDYYLAAIANADRTLTEDAIEALQAFADGTFSPEGHPRRSANPSGLPLVTTSFRVPMALLQRIDPSVRVGYVVKAWLAHKYPKPAE